MSNGRDATFTPYDLCRALKAADAPAPKGEKPWRALPAQELNDHSDKSNKWIARRG